MAADNLSTGLLFSAAFRERLFLDIKNSECSLLIASAFIKLDALEAISSQVPSSVSRVQVIARWRKQDLISGASDLAIYEFCESRNWSFGINLDFHGKLYVIDRKTALVGSANLTSRGFSLSGLSNVEIGARLSANGLDIARIEAFLCNEVTWVDNHVFRKIEEEIDENLIPAPEKVSQGWSEAILSQIERRAVSLWVADLLLCQPAEILAKKLTRDTSVSHDLMVFNLSDEDVDGDTLKAGFRSSTVYRWLVWQLEEEGSIRHGALRSKLHSSLLDQDLPYRSQISRYVENLFSWMQFLPEDFEVKRHNHTSSVSLCRSEDTL
ncbi:phospholipase D-like domain-containing protein [Luminiphilus sp.]|nr:phospholipase D-like domain-containing protein [Luminiphilus sp.]